MGILDDLFGASQGGAQTQDPFSALQSLLADIFGGGGEAPVAPPAAARMAPPSLLPQFDASEARNIPMGMDGRMPPPLARQAAPEPAVQPVAAAAPAARPAPSGPPPLMRGAPSAEPTIGDRLQAFAKGQSGNGDLLTGLAAMFGGVDREKAALSRNVQALISKGMDPQVASIVASDPALLKQVLPRMFAREMGEAPPIQKFTDEYGRETYATWDAAQKRYVPVAIPGQPGSQAAAAQPSPAPAIGTQAVPGGAVTNTTIPASAMPSLMDKLPTPEPITKTTDIGEVGASGIAPAPTPDPASLGAQAAPQAAAKPLGIPQGYVRGGPVPKIPEGYVQRPAPDGEGFLYQNGRPIFDLKAEVEARARIGEQTAVKEKAAEKGEAMTDRQVLGNIKQLGETISNVTPDEWNVGAGQYGGSTASFAEDPITYGIGSAKRAGVAAGEALFGTPRGRSANMLRQELNTAGSDLVMTYRAIQKQRGVSDSQQSNADLEFLKSVVGQLPTSNSREEAAAILNWQVRPIFERILGKPIPPFELKQWVKVKK